MSIRTFDKFFASKDDLLVAVHETIMTTEVVPRLHRQCEKESDPLGRIRAYIEGIYELTANPRPASRALSTFRSRLAETRPADLEHSMRPQLDMVVDLVRSAFDSGLVFHSLSPRCQMLLLACYSITRYWRPCTPGCLEEQRPVQRICGNSPPPGSELRRTIPSC